VREPLRLPAGDPREALGLNPVRHKPAVLAEERAEQPDLEHRAEWAQPAEREERVERPDPVHRVESHQNLATSSGPDQHRNPAPQMVHPPWMSPNPQHPPRVQRHPLRVQRDHQNRPPRVQQNRPLQPHQQHRNPVPKSVHRVHMAQSEPEEVGDPLQSHGCVA
jgi:hypothetical protein